MSQSSVLAPLPAPPEPLDRPGLAVGFGVLGPVVVGAAGDLAVLPPGKPTTLLACLLLRPNTVVSTERLKAAVWDHHAEGNTALHTGVRRLRRLLLAHGVGGDVVRAEAGGYRIAVSPDALDLTRFRRGVTAARTESDPAAELLLLRDALEEWQGPLLSNVTSDVVHRDEVPRLVEERLGAQERAVDLELGLGRCREVLAELWELTRAHPDRERFWEQLIEALYRTGRQTEALAQYRDVKGHLRYRARCRPRPGAAAARADDPARRPRRAGAGGAAGAGHDGATCPRLDRLGPGPGSGHGSGGGHRAHPAAARPGRTQLRRQDRPVRRPGRGAHRRVRP